MKVLPAIGLIALGLTLMGVKGGCERGSNQEEKDQRAVQDQQAQYAARQPIPTFNWSLERELVRKLYEIRNARVSTHSVWRSDYGTIEGDCPSMGYGLPYDTSLTNPWQGDYIYNAAVAIGQAEPNGVFASTNTAATWVICVGDGGALEPVYVESKVTVYPGIVDVDYDKNRVTPGGGERVQIKLGGPR